MNSKWDPILKNQGIKQSWNFENLKKKFKNWQMKTFYFQNKSKQLEKSKGLQTSN